MYDWAKWEEWKTNQALQTAEASGNTDEVNALKDQASYYNWEEYQASQWLQNSVNSQSTSTTAT